MSTKPSDLPDFSSVLDAHATVAAGDGDGGPEAADRDGPWARDWVEGLSTNWAGDLQDAPYLAPLADIVARISALSGVPMPDSDPTERKRVGVITAAGPDDDA